MTKDEALYKVKGYLTDIIPVENYSEIAEIIKALKQVESVPSAEPLVLTCDGCRHVGTYDTDFPCSSCVRREKDYYEQER